MQCDVPTSANVYPSAGDFATTSVPMVPPEPGRFSTMTRLPASALMVSASRRAIVSPVPPAASGTMILIGFDGYSSTCASAGVAINVQNVIGNTQSKALSAYSGDFPTAIILNMAFPPLSFSRKFNPIFMPSSIPHASFSQFTSPFLSMIPIRASGRGLKWNSRLPIRMLPALKSTSTAAPGS